MTIYCPLAEALGIDPGGFSILDIKDDYCDHINYFIPWNKGMKTGPEPISTRQKKSASHKGKKQSKKQNAAISKALKNKPKSESHKQALSGPKTEEHKQAMRKPKAKITCEICGKSMSGGNFIKWKHGPNCNHTVSTERAS